MTFSSLFESVRNAIGRQSGHSRRALQSGRHQYSAIESLESKQLLTNGLTVVLDPGHGQTLPNGTRFTTHGTSGYWTGNTETFLTLDIAQRMKQDLQSMGFTVYLTRDIYDVDYDDRSKLADNVDADFFLSLHFNGFERGSGTRGTETFVHPAAGNVNYQQDRTFAQIMQNATLSSFSNGVDRGVKESPWAVLNDSWLGGTAVSALLEIESISSNYDVDMAFNNPQRREDVAQKISDGILLAKQQLFPGSNVDLLGYWTDVQSNGQWGQPITVQRIQVQNQGTSASGSFGLQFYLSRDSVGSPDDILLMQPNGQSTIQHPGIAGNGMGTMMSTTLNLPAQKPSGWNGDQFFVVMKTDATNSVSETAEGNNFGQVGETFDYDRIQIANAVNDVDLRGYWTDVQSSGSWGQQINISKYQVQNLGNAASGSFAIQFYLSKDSTGSSDDVLLNQPNGSSVVWYSSVGAKSLGPEHSLTLQLPAQRPAGWNDGRLYVVMKTDSFGNVTETVEMNNFGQVGETWDFDRIEISGGSGQADLQGNWLDAQSSASWGSVVTLNKVQVKNAGTAQSGSFALQFYLSKDQYGSSDDLLLSLANGATSFQHSSIAANSVGSMLSLSVKMPGRRPTGWTGTKFYIVMKTDAFNQVAESNETNNFGAFGTTWDNDWLNLF